MSITVTLQGAKIVAASVCPGPAGLAAGFAAGPVILDFPAPPARGRVLRYAEEGCGVPGLANDVCAVCEAVTAEELAALVAAGEAVLLSTRSAVPWAVAWLLTDDLGEHSRAAILAELGNEGALLAPRHDWKPGAAIYLVDSRKAVTVRSRWASFGVRAARILMGRRLFASAEHRALVAFALSDPPTPECVGLVAATLRAQGKGKESLGWLAMAANSWGPRFGDAAPRAMEDELRGL